MILPGATLGILGGGQLGQMFTLAARRMGYGVWVLDPDPDCPAAAVADRHLCARYDDFSALELLADHCAAVTAEFENVPASAMIYLEARIPVRPGSTALVIAQDRVREKTFFQDLGLEVAPFALLRQKDDVELVPLKLSFPAILKTTRFGYDGKGQQNVTTASELPAAWASLNTPEAILESRIKLVQEFSVVLARSVEGMMVFYPLAENRHHHAVLDLSIVPARIPEALQNQARQSAACIAEALNYVGVLAVEFFVEEEGRLLVNEMAPRPHNSGHYTIDACVSSQFDQQVRALCGLSLADTRLLSPVVMMNLLGDLWEEGGPDWQKLFQHPQIKVHLYGKKEARPGRKMGHVNALSSDVERALAVLETLRQDWNWPR
ncbi:5-(carboxyamino)imidazole ribonucleotide synthase [Acidithiobacillus thiooxidans]|uniref:N5-carboxyaminoimidazole ribonucleotide synthase n=1 Tax=Acidithiobacillus thiooxidans ATCC 19377 TaxID=637390 RepID=A0A543Q0Z0_ACITH|nr:5-(carboxyamino)imidazole ribonucleotide synthase [Acidithiobacillus thiooxidans]MDR7928064.1 5-(carboxyamino)imidazole ribonucleotide synthase [Acidithiobacillus thiooxidans]MDX5933350.1 5-(carboxyamino)imidazole ribonucleotide synthase [Acidithiobacillus thiooxidans]TQN49940.1 N5-carboxyaminoimidazole ribonucleotide synthase [Acidithiobacillus thiooxidans ATCC 19377]